MVLTGCRESGTLVRRNMALLCLAGEVLLCLAGKALLFLRIEPSSLRDRPDMRCSSAWPAHPARSGVRPASCLPRRPAKPYRCSRRAAGVPPWDAIDAAATRPGPGSLPAGTAPPEETWRAGSAPVVPVPVLAKVRSVAPWPGQRTGPAALVQASHGRAPFSGAVPYSP